MEDEKDEILDLLQSEETIISREEVCRKLNSIELLEFETLLSNHEEADTKVIAHAIEYLSSINEKNVHHQEMLISLFYVCLCYIDIRKEIS